jgi:diketogulonate reductase-like aldo/keto reductase
MSKAAIFIYGTAWKEDATASLVTQALAVGFRAIDTANQRKHYHEAAVGDALRQAFATGTLTRDDLFLQTKFTFQAGQDHRLPYDAKASIAKQVAQSFDSSLQHLGVNYIDSLILHGPSQAGTLGDADHQAWRAMEKLVADKRVGVIGISNIVATQLRQLVEFATVAPAFVQNRCYASRHWDREVRLICDESGIIYQGFSLLTANRSVVDSKVVAAIAARCGGTSQQVVFSFARALGMVPLTGSSSAVHLQQDLQALQFVLSEQEIATITSLATT